MRADFYLITKPRFLQAPLLLVCELAKRTYQAQQPTIILARSADQAEELDDLLWAFEPDAYIPHQIAGAQEDQDFAPVLIVPPELEAPHWPMVINLREAAWEGACERVLEVDPADPAGRESQRERWRHYKARGFALHKHDI